MKQRLSISNQAERYNYCMAHLQNKKQECFEVLFLDIKLRLIAAEVLCEGNVDNATVYPRKLIELILKYGAKHIICVHNHPGTRNLPAKINL